MTAQPEYASAVAVAGLARELEALRRAVEALRDLPRRVEELAALVARLAEQSATAGGGGGEGTATWLDHPCDPAPCSRAGHDADLLLVRLTDWMATVYLRYGDARGLPACWLWHPEAVEELVWLRQAWLAAYTDPDAPVAAAGDWHDRQRPGVVRRIRDYAGMCSVENHQPGQQPVAVPLAGAVTAIAEWWTTRRPAAPPEPTPEQVAEAGSLARTSRGARR
jgi:hypothetical protein